MLLFRDFAPLAASDRTVRHTLPPTTPNMSFVNNFEVIDNFQSSALFTDKTWYFEYFSIESFDIIHLHVKLYHSSSSSSSIYFPLNSIYIYMDKKNRREERRCGTAGTGVSQKDLQIEKNSVTC